MGVGGRVWRWCGVSGVRSNGIYYFTISIKHEIDEWVFYSEFVLNI